MPDKKIINIINSYIEDLKAENIQLSKVILYGSYAKGTANKNSDIDLILVSPEFDENRDKYLGIIWKLTEKSNFLIEPYTIGLNKFLTDDISPIIQIAKKEGFEIPIRVN